MNVDLKVEFDKGATKAELSQRWKRGLMVATSELRRYSNQYVRWLSGTMMKSSFIHSDLRKGLVVYDTPYAHLAYYNETSHVTTDHNPNARPKWGEYAIDHHLKDIERTVQREVSR